MNGAELNKKLERGLLGSSIKRLVIAKALAAPSDPERTRGVENSVTEQAHAVDAAWENGTLSIYARPEEGHIPKGPGLWIPYLGNVDDRSYGTYTPAMGNPSVSASWVGTGPFSGCYAVTLTTFQGKVFAHVVTKTEGCAVQPALTQAHHIANQITAPQLTQAALDKMKVSSGEGWCYVFWTKKGDNWWRRVLVTSVAEPGKIVSVGKRSEC
ncbi:MAG: hypothetical protein HKM95_17445 [Inquilinus sp.]|nr:hypothetical protein [Inquilinus sp.]